MNREESIFGRLTTRFRSVVSPATALVFLVGLAVIFPLLYFPLLMLRRELAAAQQAHMLRVAEDARDVVADALEKSTPVGSALKRASALSALELSLTPLLRKRERLLAPGGRVLIVQAHRPGWLLPRTEYPGDYTIASIRKRFARNFTGISLEADLRKYLENYGDTPQRQFDHIRTYMQTAGSRVVYPLAAFDGRNDAHAPDKRVLLLMAVQGRGFLTYEESRKRLAAYRPLQIGNVHWVVVALAPPNNGAALLSRLLKYFVLVVPAAALLIAVCLFVYLGRFVRRSAPDVERAREQYERLARPRAAVLLGPNSPLKPGDNARLEATMLTMEMKSLFDVVWEPEATFPMINDYASWAGPLIEEQGGYMHRFTGNVWSALFPHGAASALRAAVALRRGLADFRSRFPEYFDSPAAFVLGLHGGAMNVGVLESHGPVEMALVSTVVRTSHRVRGLASVMGAGIACGEETLYAVENPDEFRHRFLGTVPVREKERISVFEIFEGESTARLKTETRNEFENGIERFYAREFAPAAELFTRVLEVNPEDAAAQLYLKRSREHE